MSFSKTVSVVAALASIFSVGLASWKISEEIKNGQTAPLEQKIQELEKKLEEKEEQPLQQPTTIIPAPVNLPPTQTQLPPPSPPPPVTNETP